MDILGSYVSYKNKTYLVTEVRRKNLLRILNPCGEKPEVLQVSHSSINVLPLEPAARVELDERPYLVTGKGLIISVLSGKIMKWNISHPNVVKLRNAAYQVFITR